MSSASPPTSLRLLDLRGTPPPYDAVLPRPDDPGADVHDTVAEVLRRVKDAGEAPWVLGELVKGEGVVRYR